MKKIAEIDLIYKNKLYHVKDEYEEDYPDDVILYRWEDGNFACDCNRSIFIREQIDNNFEELNCGKEIKIKKLGIQEAI